MRVESNKDERICYNIQDVIVTNPKEHLEHLLFAHAFSGCDATLQIHNFGKKSIFGKLKKSSGLLEIFRKIYSNSVTVSEESSVTIRFFELIYSPSFTLQKIRKQNTTQLLFQIVPKLILHYFLLLLELHFIMVLGFIIK